MNAHRFDPLSAVFGLLAVGAGVVVIAGAGEVVDSRASGTWTAVGALAIGVLLLPWDRRRHRPLESRRDSGPVDGSDLVDGSGLVDGSDLVDDDT